MGVGQPAMGWVTQHWGPKGAGLSTELLSPLQGGVAPSCTAPSTLLSLWGEMEMEGELHWH